MVGGAGLCDRLWPFRMIDTVRVELGLQSYTAALVIMDTALTGFVQIVSGIKLDAGTVSGDCHGSAGAGIPEDGAGIAEYFVIVVISALKLQRFIILINIPADCFRLAEIHWRVFYRAQFAGGDILSVIGIEKPSGEDQCLFHGSFDIFMACQIKVAVVCQI